MKDQSILVRRAVPEDADSIAAVQHAVWPNEAVRPALIARAIAEPEHVTHAAVLHDQVIGFVDGFITLAATGKRRWEVDLLAVHPDYRGRGTARMLVEATTQAGQEMGAADARALIQIENLPSQRTFSRCGYSMDAEPVALWVASADLSRSREESLELPPGEHYLLPVTTLQYRGIWVEQWHSEAALRLARRVIGQTGLDLAGCLIALGAADEQRSAQRAGYAHVNDYRWWCCQQPRPEND